MPQAEARSWWADVEHLRPGADGPAADATPQPLQAPRGRRFERSVAEDAELSLRRRFERVHAQEALPLEEPEWEQPTPAERRARQRADVRETEQANASTRRTVQITGRPVSLPAVPRLVEVERRRPPRRPIERIGPRPDRFAIWAVGLGIFLCLVALTTSSHAATSLGDRVLKPGMVGRDVRHLQLRLKHLGFFHAPATARYGAITKHAVKDYQRSRCLAADGIAGPGTVHALRAHRRACHH